MITKDARLCALFYAGTTAVGRSPVRANVGGGVVEFVSGGNGIGYPDQSGSETGAFFSDQEAPHE